MKRTTWKESHFPAFWWRREILRRVIFQDFGVNVLTQFVLYSVDKKYGKWIKKKICWSIELDDLPQTLIYTFLFKSVRSNWNLQLDYALIAHETSSLHRKFLVSQTDPEAANTVAHCAVCRIQSEPFASRIVLRPNVNCKRYRFKTKTNSTYREEFIYFQMTNNS